MEYFVLSVKIVMVLHAEQCFSRTVRIIRGSIAFEFIMWRQLHHYRIVATRIIMNNMNFLECCAKTLMGCDRERMVLLDRNKSQIILSLSEDLVESVVACVIRTYNLSVSQGTRNSTLLYST